MYKLTCLIPLYASKRFKRIITANIDNHLRMGAKVIISDRHLIDNTAEYLSTRYHNNANVIVLINTDMADWVENINSLMSHVDTPFFRIVPHDDSASATSSQLLLDALLNEPKAVLASGVVHAKNLLGLRTKKLDELNLHTPINIENWRPQHALNLYWEGRFGGAFKGVIRTQTVHQNKLLIKKTPTLVHSERTWLFALALQGAFCFVPKAVLIKRYYSNSTQKTWKYTDQTTLDAASTMTDYCDELISNAELAYNIKLNTYYQALKQIRNDEPRKTWGGSKPPLQRIKLLNLRDKT